MQAEDLLDETRTELPKWAAYVLYTLYTYALSLLLTLRSARLPRRREGGLSFLVGVRVHLA